MRRRFKNDKDTVVVMVKALATKFGGLFHISDMKKAVLLHMPDASITTIHTAVWNLTNKFHFLESPRKFHYQVRKTAEQI